MRRHIRDEYTGWIIGEPATTTITNSPRQKRQTQTSQLPLIFPLFCPRLCWRLEVVCTDIVPSDLIRPELYRTNLDTQRKRRLIDVLCLLCLLLLLVFYLFCVFFLIPKDICSGGGDNCICAVGHCFGGMGWGVWEAGVYMKEGRAWEVK